MALAHDLTNLSEGRSHVGAIADLDDDARDRARISRISPDDPIERGRDRNDSGVVRVEPSQALPLCSEFANHRHRNAVDANLLPYRALVAKQFFGDSPPEHDHLAALDHVRDVKGAAPGYGPVADSEILGRRTGYQGGPVRIPIDQLHSREIVLRRGRDYSRDFVLDGLRVRERNARS